MAITQTKGRASLDHLVGPCEQYRRYIQADRFCGLEVDDQFELGWLLDRQVARPLAAKDAIGIGCGTSVQVDRIDPIRTAPSSA
jgi:hypothetical protein